PIANRFCPIIGQKQFDASNSRRGFAARCLDMKPIVRVSLREPGDDEGVLRNAGRISGSDPLLLSRRAVVCGAAMFLAESTTCWAEADAGKMTAREVVRALFLAEPGSPVDLSGKDFSGLDLSRIDFKGANLSRANLFGAD